MDRVRIVTNISLKVAAISRLGRGRSAEPIALLIGVSRKRKPTFKYAIPLIYKSVFHTCLLPTFAPISILDIPAIKQHILHEI